MNELGHWIAAHPGWITLWLVLVWFIIGEYRDLKNGERY